MPVPRKREDPFSGMPVGTSAIHSEDTVLDAWAFLSEK